MLLTGIPKQVVEVGLRENPAGQMEGGGGGGGGVGGGGGGQTEI